MLCLPEGVAGRRPSSSRGFCRGRAARARGAWDDTLTSRLPPEEDAARSVAESSRERIARDDVAKLVESYRPVLLGRARLFCRDRAEAEDLVQSTIVRALEHSHQLSSPDKARSWLVQIMTRLFIDRIRRPQDPLTYSSVDLTELASPDPDPTPSWAEVTTEQFQVALRRLDDDFRAPFTMAEIEGRSHRDIAQTLGISVATVATRILRARRKLKAMLLPEDTEEP